MKGTLGFFAAILTAGSVQAQDIGTAPKEAAASSASPVKPTVSIPEILGIAASPPAVPPQEWQPLESKGIRLALSYVGEAAANPTGGVSQGEAYTGQIYGGASFDLEKIFGLDNTTLNLGVANRHGDSLSADFIRNNTSVQAYHGYMGTRLAILMIEHQVNDSLSIEVGRGHANPRYLTSPYYCLFQSNAMCGNPTIMFKNSNITGFPASTWMANVRVRLAERLAFQTGVFEVNPDRIRPKDDNTNLSLKNATGVYIPFELTYGTSPLNDRLPRHYTVGGWFDRSDYQDPLLDDRGGIARLSGRPAMTRFGRSAVYARFDQMVVRNSLDGTKGLSLNGAVVVNTSGRVPLTRSLQVGAVQTGTFRGRDEDTLGFFISDQRFSNLFLADIRAARASVGSTVEPKRHQYMMELAYGLKVRDDLRLTPNIQYIINPDTSGAPFSPRNSDDALVFGIRLSVDGPTLFGSSGR